MSKGKKKSDKLSDKLRELKSYKKQVEMAIASNKDNLKKYYNSQKFIMTKEGQFSQEENGWFESNGKPKMVANKLIIEYLRTVGAQSKMERQVIPEPVGGYSLDDNQANDQLQAAVNLHKKIIESIACHSDATEVYKATFKSAWFGIGAFRLKRDYDDDSFDQSFRIISLEDPTKYYFDPNSKDILKRKGDYMGYLVMMTGSEIKNKYKVDIKDNDLLQNESGIAENTFSWSVSSDDDSSDDNIFMVCHHYYKEYKTKNISLLSNGIKSVTCDTVDADDRLAELNEQNMAQSTQMGMQQPEFSVVKTRDMSYIQIRELIFCGSKILVEAQDWVTNNFPVYIVCPLCYTDEQGKFHTIPISYFAEEPQKLQNVAMCALAEALTRYRKEKYIMERANLPENSNDLSKWLNLPESDGPVIVQPTLSFPQGPRLLETQEIDMGLIQSVTQISSVYNDVTGRTPSSQVKGGGLDPGDMIEKIALQDLDVNALYMDSLEKAIVACAQDCCDGLPNLYDTQRTLNLRENNKIKKFEINNPMRPETMMNKGDKYKITIKAGPSFEMQRKNTADTLLKYIGLAPSVLLPLLADILVKNLDINNSQDIADRMDYLLDPRILAKEGINIPSPPGANKPNPEMLMAMIKQKELQLKQVQLQQQSQQAKTDDQSKQAQQQIDMQKQQLEQELAMLDYTAKIMQMQHDHQSNLMKSQTEALKSRAEIVKAVEATHTEHAKSRNIGQRG